MLNVKIKNARIAKGLTQEELAVLLNITRQTVSKWEKGLSVPDSNMLIKLSEVLDVTVSDLLGTDTREITNHDGLDELLGKINEQLAEKNRRDKRVAKIVTIIVGTFVLISLLLVISGVAGFIKLQSNQPPAYVNIDGTEVEIDPDNPPIEISP